MSKSAGHGLIGARIPLYDPLTRREDDGKTVGLEDGDRANLGISDPSDPNYQNRVNLTCSIYDLIEQTGPFGDFKPITEDSYDAKTGQLTLTYKTGTCGDEFQKKGKIIVHLTSPSNPKSVARSGGLENASPESRLITRSTVKMDAELLQEITKIESDEKLSETEKDERVEALREKHKKLLLEQKGSRISKPDWLQPLPDALYDAIYDRRLQVFSKEDDGPQKPIEVLANKPRTAEDLYQVLANEKYTAKIDEEKIKRNPIFQLLKNEEGSPLAHDSESLMKILADISNGGTLIFDSVLENEDDIVSHIKANLANISRAENALEKLQAGEYTEALIRLNASIEEMNALLKTVRAEEKEKLQSEIERMREVKYELQLIQYATNKQMHYELMMLLAHQAKISDQQSLLEALLEDKSSPFVLSTKGVTGDDDGLATCPPRRLINEIKAYNKKEGKKDPIQIDTVFNTFNSSDKKLNAKALKYELKKLFRYLKNRADENLREACAEYTETTGKVLAEDELPPLSFLRATLTPVEMLLLGIQEVEGKVVSQPLKVDEIYDDFFLKRAGCIKPYEFLMKMLSNHATRLKNGSPLHDERFESELNSAYRAAMTDITGPVEDLDERQAIIERATQGFEKFYEAKRTGAVGRYLPKKSHDEVLCRLKEFLATHMERRLASGEGLKDKIPNPQFNSLMMATLQHGDDNRNPYGSDIEGKVLVQINGHVILLENPSQLIAFLIETKFTDYREFDLNWGWDMRPYPETGLGWIDVARAIEGRGHYLAEDIVRAKRHYETIKNLEETIENPNTTAQKRENTLQSLWVQVQHHRVMNPKKTKYLTKDELKTMHMQSIKLEHLEALKAWIESKTDQDKDEKQFLSLFDKPKELAKIVCPKDRLAKPNAATQAIKPN